ncbi:hypothetical protein BT69DRAFT_1234740 [Atractiella rhizophila]|nr:hypothetical protein BT69DRAFT_1234740 [Atractiella rhizophila]
MSDSQPSGGISSNTSINEPHTKLVREMVTILAPVAYLAFLIGSLYTFSKVYRRRKAAAATSAKPWFPPHHERDLYISLLSMEPPPPDSLLKAALLNRAFQDIKRLMRLNQAKAALSTLLQKGQVGDDIWNRFLEAEKEHQAELQEVVQEANTFREGWGQFIFVTANEMVSHTFQKENYASVEKEGNGVSIIFCK